MIEGNFIFSSIAKRRIFTFLGVGIVLLAIGIFLISRPNSEHGHEEHGSTTKVEAHGGDQTHAHVEHAQETPTVHNESPASKETSKDAHAEGGHDAHATHWSLRLIKDLWLNNIFFTGIAVMGVFFVAFNYIAQAGWSAGIKRVPEAFGYYLPFGFLMAVVLFGFFHHDLFHWTHDYLYNKLLADGSKNPQYDEIIDGKKGFLNMGFYWFRLIVYYALWILVWFKLRSFSIEEDKVGGLENHNRSIVWSGLFLVIFGITSSTSAWDWVMSMDPHFFSTMFGWYVFASWFVSGLAAITLVVVLLREAGYLKNVNESHIHDLGKFVFAFSIFWTYIWFAQFLLIYYANIPEEAVYFVERLKNDVYSPIFFMNFIINFCFPFLVLMTRNAKRQTIILKIVCIAILFGHWMDFYIMMTPPLLKDAGGMDLNFFFVELGSAMIFGSIFVYLLLMGLSKAPMIAKNHPMLEESVHHHIY